MENKDTTTTLEDKKNQTSDDYVKLVNHLVELRNMKTKEAAKTVYNDLKSNLDKPKVKCLFVVM